MDFENAKADLKIDVVKGDFGVDIGEGTNVDGMIIAIACLARAFVTAYREQVSEEDNIARLVQEAVDFGIYMAEKTSKKDDKLS